MATDKPDSFPKQHQDKQPGLEEKMQPEPDSTNPSYKGSDKLKDKVALITGGDSGIGKAAAILFAREGADVAIVYLNEHEDAEKTKSLIEKEGARCLLIDGDIGKRGFCQEAVQQTIDTFGKLDVLVNNAAVQYPQESLEDITEEQLEKTFRTNIFSIFYMTQAALPHLKEGSAIINTGSIVAFRGHAILLDYAATKGAIIAFTRSLAQNLAERGIRVNAVAPGPIWTPLIPASFDAEKVVDFGQDTALGRAGQPEEVAPAYIWLASDEASYIVGQTIHVNGGQIVGA